jgi:hypothetical protein
VSILFFKRNCRFEFHKRRQLFISVHNESLSVAAMRVGNKDRSPLAIQSWHTAPTPSGFAEIVGDDFQYFIRTILTD